MSKQLFTTVEDKVGGEQAGKWVPYPIDHFWIGYAYKASITLDCVGSEVWITHQDGQTLKFKTLGAALRYMGSVID